MGKGDKKSKRGKIIISSYGVSRSKKKKFRKYTPEIKPKANKEEAIEAEKNETPKKKTTRTTTAKKAATKKATTKKTTVKKTIAKKTTDEDKNAKKPESTLKAEEKE